MNFKGIGILLIGLLSAGKGFVMEDCVSGGLDSVSVAGEIIVPDTLFHRDSIIPVRPYFHRDTLMPVSVRPMEKEERIPLVYLPDSLIRDSLAYEYTKIKDFASKSKFTRELYKWFL